jgi:hypothetical protein
VLKEAGYEQTEPSPAKVEEPVVEVRKTIAQALREWEEISASEGEADDEAIKEIVEKTSKTWLSKFGVSGSEGENS